MPPTISDPLPIDANYVKTYASNVSLALQQRRSHLRPAVTEEVISGEEAFFDNIGSVESRERTGEFEDIEPTQSPHERRRVTFTERYRAEYVGEMSKLRMISDPTSAYVENSVSALNRAIDKIVVDAVFGTAWTGKDGQTTVPFPASQTIAHGSAGLTIDKLIEAREMLDAAEIDDAEQRFMVVTARQISDLLNTTEVTSSDYNSVKALVGGQVDSFMGFKFIRYQGLPIVAGATQRRCIAMTKSAVKLGVARDIHTSADWVATKRAYLLYAGLAMGATRMNEKKVIAIECQE